MPIRVLHLSDIHLGSGLCHGKTNPATGLNTRFEDFVQTLQSCIDRALGVTPHTSFNTPSSSAEVGTGTSIEPVDLVIFGGDAFPDATPPPVVQEAFAQQFRRLVDAQIPVVLLVGNHDQHAQGQGGSSLSIYRTLGIPRVVVGDRLETHSITTRQGVVQVVTLPWLTRSTLLTREETEGLPLSAVNELLLDRLRVALEGEIRQLDPHHPTILLAHLMVDTASYGAERFLAMGKGLTVPLALLNRPCFDYVALGHVHRHQVLGTHPPIVYPGSIERVDFSEEEEAKGTVLVELEKGQAKVEFCPLTVRPFHTLRVDLSELDPTEFNTPQQRLIEAIATAPIDNAVVRLIYRVSPEQLHHIDHNTVCHHLRSAHTYTIHPELVSQMTRPRLPDLTATQTTNPIDALKTYLDHHPELAEMADDMIATATALQLHLTSTDQADELTYSVDLNVDDATPNVSETVDQLRLL